MEVKQISIKSIKPYQKNAKLHSNEQIRSVANSIKKFGWQQPIVIDKDNEIIIGHCRFEAAKTLGEKTVPCVIADDLSEEEVKALRLADNKTNESAWDNELLSEEVAKLPEFDFTDFGFDEFELVMLNSTEEENEEEYYTEENNEAQTQSAPNKRVIIIMHGDEEQEKVKKLFGIVGDLKPAYRAEDLMVETEESENEN